MLVLTRQLNQAVHMDGGITVKVLAIERDQVRLGFDAPKETQIWREERRATPHENRKDFEPGGRR